MRRVKVTIIITVLTSISQLVNSSPLGFPPLPFIRGGSSTTTKQRPKQKQPRRRQRNRRGPFPGPAKVIINVKQGLDKIGQNIQKDWANVHFL